MKILIIIKTNLLVKTGVLLFGYKNGIGHLDMQLLLDFFAPCLDIWTNSSLHTHYLYHAAQEKEIPVRLIFKPREKLELISFYPYRSSKEILGIRHFIFISPIYALFLKFRICIFIFPCMFISLKLKDKFFNLFIVIKKKNIFI